MIFQSNFTDRQLYDQAREAMRKAGISNTAYDNAVKTYGALRFIQPITTGQQIIQFPVLQNQTGAGQATRQDEIRLPQQNAFFVGQMYVKIFVAAAGNFNYVQHTWPNPVTFTNAASYYNFYNGIMNWTIDQSVIARAYPMSKFLKIPVTQLTGATNSPQDSFDGVDMVPWEPNVVMVGTSQIDLQVKAPGVVGTIDANSFMMIDCYGIEAQNVALGAIQ